MERKVWVAAVISVATVSVAAGQNYAGNIWIYLLFSLLANLLLANGLDRRALYFETFVGIFLWMGFWIKFTVKLFLHEAGFNESLFFDRSPAAYDHALIVSCVGFVGFIVATNLRRLLFVYPDFPTSCKSSALFQLYSRYRKFAIASFFIIVALVAISNAWLGIYQRGMIARTQLPHGLGGIYSWLLQFGLASIGALIVRYEIEIKGELSIISVACALIEPFLSNVSMLSRGMILNFSALAFGALRHVSALEFRPRFSKMVAITGAFIVLFSVSVLTVNGLRAGPYALVGELNSYKALKSRTDSIRGMTTPLFIDRWVGIEGVVAVASSDKLGWLLWNRAWQEEVQYGVSSIYDKDFIDTPYKKDRSAEGLHFVTMPGAIAFFFYSGSLAFLFVTIILCAVVGAALEVAAYRYGGKNWIFCALVGQVVAYRLAHFGYVPAQSYLLFGAVGLNIAIFFMAEKSSEYYLKNKTVKLYR